eukprot:989008-Prorocentrum_lima.AAC.1
MTGVGCSKTVRLVSLNVQARGINVTLPLVMVFAPSSSAVRSKNCVGVVVAGPHGVPVVGVFNSAGAA